jgi:hypothetical protein
MLNLYKYVFICKNMIANYGKVKNVFVWTWNNKSKLCCLLSFYYYDINMFYLFHTCLFMVHSGMCQKILLGINNINGELFLYEI